jgi:hypothetical protein
MRRPFCDLRGHPQVMRLSTYNGADPDRCLGTTFQCRCSQRCHFEERAEGRVTSHLAVMASTPKRRPMARESAIRAPTPFSLGSRRGRGQDEPCDPPEWLEGDREFVEARRLLLEASRYWREAGGYWPVEGAPSHPPEWSRVVAAQEHYEALGRRTMPRNPGWLLRDVRAHERSGIATAIDRRVYHL